MASITNIFLKKKARSVAVVPTNLHHTPSHIHLEVVMEYLDGSVKLHLSLRHHLLFLNKTNLPLKGNIRGLITKFHLPPGIIIKGLRSGSLLRINRVEWV